MIDIAQLQNFILNKTSLDPFDQFVSRAEWEITHTHTLLENHTTDVHD